MGSIRPHHAGCVKIEVKSATFLQSCYQTRLSSISYLTPHTRAWDANTNVQSPDAKRQADVYVFALLDHKDKATIDPLNVDQWRFLRRPNSGSEQSRAKPAFDHSGHWKGTVALVCDSTIWPSQWPWPPQLTAVCLTPACSRRRLMGS